MLAYLRLKATATTKAASAETKPMKFQTSYRPYSADAGSSEAFRLEGMYVQQQQD
jgi:hypothetical protein